MRPRQETVGAVGGPMDLRPASPPRLANPREYPYIARRLPTADTAAEMAPGSGMRTVIRPPSRWPGAGLGELWQYRSVGLVVARRALMVRYRQTLVGAAWVLLQPLLMMAVFALFFGLLMTRFIGSVPYEAYLFSGLTVWILVSRVLSQGAASISANKGLLTKIYFPRAYLPIGVALSGLVDFLFGLIALLVLALWYAIVPNIGVVMLPVIATLALATALGAAFWLSALDAKYRDVSQLMPFLIQVGFFSTPIFWAPSIVAPELREYLWLNPISTAVEATRAAFLGTEWPPLDAWAISSIVAVTLLVTGYLFFRTREHTFADAL